ncbi:MAG: AMP-dependent synthetase [Marmoricola sp.]|nr:AMP-dependent synthetase [Marmoricola sp.]
MDVRELARVSRVALLAPGSTAYAELVRRGVFPGLLEPEAADTLVAEERDLVLAEVDGVEDVAVFGVADDRWRQRVCAAVVGTVDDATLPDLERPD